MTDDDAGGGRDEAGSRSPPTDRSDSDPLDWPPAGDREQAGDPDGESPEGPERVDGVDRDAFDRDAADRDAAGRDAADGDAADGDAAGRDAADGDAAGRDAADGPLADDSDAPLGDLASSVRDRPDRDRQPVDDELFEEQDVTPIDADAVWDRLEAEESTETDDETSVRQERVIEKSSYCERCPFFSAPPDVQCTHEGTSILELVDVDRFRVADCPKVAESERLEEL